MTIQFTPGAGGAAVLEEIYVMPGEVRVAAMPTRFLTILGSCIAICLYDRAAGVGGISHFLLPGQPQTQDGDPLRWSAPSTASLFAAVQAAGARASRLEAKIFGGAAINAREVPDRLRIGARNFECAVAELQQRGVPLASHDAGGGIGRKIIFEAHTGMVWMKELRQRRD
jgi:chemotaxis protein CheD